MDPIKKTARRAGLLYLLMGITSGFGIMYIPMNIMVPGDPLATAQNILNSEWLFRLSIFCNLTGQVLFIFLVLALNQLLKEVNAYQAKLMVTLVVVAVPIAFLNIANAIIPLVLLNAAEFTNVFQPDQLHALASVFLHLYEQGTVVVEIFWGLWFFPLGMLVYQSGFIPKIFGILLIIACFGYLANSFTAILFPDYQNWVAPITSVTGTVGEFSIIFWLLIKGVRYRGLSADGSN